MQQQRGAPEGVEVRCLAEQQLQPAKQHNPRRHALRDMREGRQGYRLSQMRGRLQARGRVEREAEERDARRHAARV